MQQTVECSVQGVPQVSDRITARFESVALALAENPTVDHQADAVTEDSPPSVRCERVKVVRIQPSLAKLENLPPQVIRIERIKIPRVRLPRQFMQVHPPCPKVVVDRDTI